MSRWWNSTRPKYINGEPPKHIKAKKVITNVLTPLGYQVREEWVIQTMHHGQLTPFPIDLRAYNQAIQDQIFIQLDGGYHQASNIQIGRTKNRDNTLAEYCQRHCTRYVVFPSVDDVLNEYDEGDLRFMLGLAKYHNLPSSTSS